MASVKLILRKAKVLADGSHPIIIQVLKDGRKAIHSIGVAVYAADWDDKRNLPKNKRMAMLCNKKLIEAQEYLFEAIEYHWSAKRVADLLSGKLTRTVYFCDWANQFMDEMKANGHASNAYSYANPVNQFCNFLKNDIPIKDLTYNVLTKFVQNKSNISANTRISYLSKLRAIYNEAAERDLFVKKTNPFKRSLFTGKTKTAHRNFTANQMHSILSYKLVHFPKQIDSNKQLAVDMYKLGFMLRGMDAIDLALIRTDKLTPDCTHYEYTRKKIQSKSTKAMKVMVPSEARSIIERYWSSDQVYLFPIVKDESMIIDKSYRSYTAKLHTINKYLKYIGNELELPIALTTKTNRHTFASLAKELHIPFLYIQELLGHSLQSVTDIYMDVISQSEIDRYHRLVIDRAIKTQKQPQT